MEPEIKKEIKKVNKLLRFYYNENVEISLKRKFGVIVRGKILKKNIIGMKYVIIKGKDKSPIKIFIDNIELDSIIPLDYEKKEKQKLRSPIPPALRYKILKRDRNTCQSCGARAPDVELEVDHKIPVSKGGTDDESNLITKCKDCNRGKGDKD